MRNLIILTLTFLFEFQVLANTNTQKVEVDCSDETKTKLLIKKGAVDREFCLRVKDNNIKLLITGKLFKLASYSNSTKDLGQPLDCFTATKEKGSRIPPPTNIKVPTEKISVFEKIVMGLINKIKAFNKTKGQGEQLSDKVKIKGTGYADGTRNLMDDFDRAIFDNLEESNPGYEHKVLKTYTDGKSFYPITKKEFKEAVCSKDIRNSNRGPRNSIIPNKYITILNAARNTYLAASRAENLLNLVIANFPKDILSTPEIIANASPLTTTGQNLCKGFCTYRRGADLQMEVPGLQSLETAGPRETKKIPATIISLQQEHYPEFVPLSFVTYLIDLENFLNKDSDTKTLSYKDFLKKISVQASSIFQIKILTKNLDNEDLKLDDYYRFKPFENKVQERHKLIKQKKFVRKNENKFNIEEVRTIERDFFKHFFYKNYGIQIDNDNPYLVWARIHFWATVGMINFKDNQFKLAPNQWYKKFDSQKLVQVSEPQPSLLKKIVGNIIQNCSSIYAKEKIKDITKNEIKDIDQEIASLQELIIKKKFEENIIINEKDAYVAALENTISNPTKNNYYNQIQDKNERKIFIKYLNAKLACTHLENSIEELATDTTSPKVIMTLDSILDGALNYKMNENKDDLAKYSNGSLYLEKKAQFDGLVQETQIQGSQLADLAQNNPGAEVAKFVREEIYSLQTHPDFSADFKGKGPDLKKLLVSNSKEIYDPEKSVVMISTVGKTTSVFNFLDFSSSTLWALRNFPKIYTEKVIREIKENEQVEAIFLNVDKIQTETKNGGGKDHLIKGFFHYMCKTGMVFDMIENNNKFRYLSRMITYPDYSPRTDKKTKLYDDSYNLITDKTPPMTLMKIKHPTTYVIPKCNSCGCLKDLLLPEAKLKKDFNYTNRFREILDGAIQLDFSKGYSWKVDPNLTKIEKDKLIKKYKSEENIPKIPYLEYSAKEIIAKFKEKYPGEKPSSDEYLTSEFCIFSPIIPQPHEVGVGETEKDKDNKKDLAEAPTTTTCPLIDLLNEKINGVAQFPDIITDQKEIDEIYNHCNNLSDKLGMPEETCKSDPEQLCHALSPQDKLRFKKECSQLTMEVGDKQGANDSDFCYKLGE